MVVRAAQRKKDLQMPQEQRNRLEHTRLLFCCVLVFVFKGLDATNTHTEDALEEPSLFFV